MLLPTLHQSMPGLAWVLVTAASLHAQQSSPPPATGAHVSSTPYRPPALALVQPAAGGSVPQDRPVVMFRFAAGEPNDPIDVGSFAVTLDGEDRTKLFQVTATEAWGALALPSTATNPSISEGSHQVAARICSTRGACSETSAGVVVTNAPTPEHEATSRKRTIVDVLLQLARKLLKP
jgi:hypothetical protein